MYKLGLELKTSKEATSHVVLTWKFTNQFEFYSLYLCFWLLTGTYIYISFLCLRECLRLFRKVLHPSHVFHRCFCGPLWLPSQLFPPSIHTRSSSWLSWLSSSLSFLLSSLLSWSLSLSSDGKGQDDCQCHLTPSIANKFW